MNKTSNSRPLFLAKTAITTPIEANTTKITAITAAALFGEIRRALDRGDILGEPFSEANIAKTAEILNTTIEKNPPDLLLGNKKS